MKILPIIAIIFCLPSFVLGQEITPPNTTFNSVQVEHATLTFLDYEWPFYNYDSQSPQQNMYLDMTLEAEIMKNWNTFSEVIWQMKVATFNSINLDWFARIVRSPYNHEILGVPEVYQDSETGQYRIKIEVLSRIGILFTRK